MGTFEIKKRTTLKKQFLITFVLITLFSFFTSFLIGIFLYHYVYHTSGEVLASYDQTKINKLIEYLRHNGSSIINQKNPVELGKIIGNDPISFYITDKHHHIVYDSRKDPRNNHSQRFHGDVGPKTSHICLPIIAENTGKLDGMLVLTYNKEIWNILYIMIEYIIPFISIATFTLIFAGIFSRKLRKPLWELMNATTKIKNKDLNFTVESDLDNEIGDLAKTFEEMRRELKNSLIREW